MLLESILQGWLWATDTSRSMQEDERGWKGGLDKELQLKSMDDGQLGRVLSHKGRSQCFLVVVSNCKAGTCESSCSLGFGLQTPHAPCKSTRDDGRETYVHVDSQSRRGE